MKTLNMKSLMILLISFSILSACSEDSDKKGNPPKVGALDAGVLGKYDISAYPINKLVCDPWGGGNPQDPQSGIKATLYYRGKNTPIYHAVMPYINTAVKSEQTLFFNRIDVPTRMFTEGFPLKTGGKIKDDSGNELIEYFALKFESNLQLTADDQEGDYELALLSDDGTVLKIQDRINTNASDNAWETLITNDGDTPTRMGCTNRVIKMTRDKKVPIELYYYQGPRYHIANMLIWRKTTVAGKDQDCGKSGNSYFFDPNNNSAPKAWTAMAQRGWKVVQDGNFTLNKTLPNPTNVATVTSNSDLIVALETDYNACYDGQIPLINSFTVDEVTLTDIFVSWTTDIPATSQVLVINTTTGERYLTTTDNMLRTNHSVHIDGLSPNTTYRLQAVSISQDLGKGISSAVEVTTFGAAQ